MKDKSIGVGLTETQLKMWSKLELFTMVKEDQEWVVEESEIEKIRTIYRMTHYQGKTLEEIMEQIEKEEVKKKTKKNEPNFVLFQHTVSELGTHLHSLDNKVNEVMIGKGELMSILEEIVYRMEENHELRYKIDDVKDQLTELHQEISKRDHLLEEIRNELKSQAELIAYQSLPFWKKWIQNAK